MPEQQPDAVTELVIAEVAPTTPRCICTLECVEDGESEPSFGQMTVTAIWVDHAVTCRCVPCGQSAVRPWAAS